MLLKKNIKVGKINKFLLILFLFLPFLDLQRVISLENLSGNFTYIKVLDKISSKNISVKLKNGEEIRHKDMLIKIITRNMSFFSLDDSSVGCTADKYVFSVRRRN